MSNEDNRGKFDLPADYKGGWETDREKLQRNIAHTPEERMQALEELIEFGRHLQEAHVIR
jgi:hypothetical protein